MAGADGLQRINWSTGTVAFKDGTAGELLAGQGSGEGKRNPTRRWRRRRSRSAAEQHPAGDRATAKTLPAARSQGRCPLGKTVFVNALTQFKDSSIVHLRTFHFQTSSPPDGRGHWGCRRTQTRAGATRIVASRTERIAATAADANILQGIVEAKSGGALFTVLGITVQTFPGTTEFLQADGTPFPGATANDRQANFFAAVIEGRTVVKARGTARSSSALMTANEVRIQPRIDN